MIPIRDTIPAKNKAFGCWILIAANTLVFCFELMLPEPVLHVLGLAPDLLHHV